jgi:hypothetical protein
MKDLWKYRDLPGEVIDVTPDSYDLIRQGKFEFYDVKEDMKYKIG